MLEAFDEIGSPDRSSGVLGSTECREAVLVRMLCDESCKILDPVEDRPHGHKPIVLSFKMGAGARPLPIFGAADKTRTHRIERHIADGRSEMAFVHGDGREAVIEQMATPAAAPVDEICLSPVRDAHSLREARLVARAEDQVHMIGHQTVRPDIDLRLAHLLGEDVAIDVLVAVFEEDRLAPIAARGYVMRAPANGDARQSGQKSGDRTNVHRNLEQSFLFVRALRGFAARSAS